MAEERNASREGSLDAPTRHPLDWKSPRFYDQAAIDKELERVFDICHGCRRCVSLCQAFPVLFDLVDESSTMEVNGVAKSDYAKVVDQCYLCDLCYQTKCPYVPPHAWNVDFPHLMLRAKAAAHKRGETSFGAKVLSSTTAVGKLATIPIIVDVVNAANRSAGPRKLLDKTLGVHPDAAIPEYTHKTARKRLESARRQRNRAIGRTNARQNSAVCHVLLQLFRTAACGGSRRRAAPQRHRREIGRARSLLRHAEARTRRS